MESDKSKAIDVDSDFAVLLCTTLAAGEGSLRNNDYFF